MVTVTPKGTGAGSVTSTPAGIDCGATCSASFSSATVTLSVTPDAGSTFSGFGGSGCAGTGPCVVTLDAPTKMVTATFDVQQFVLSAGKTGGGSGTITGGGLNCGTTCMATLNAGTGVALSATPDPGSTFSGWSGCDDAAGATCNVTMTSDRMVSAAFDVATYPVSVTRAGTGTGTVTSSPAGINCGTTCNASFSGNVTLTAVATGGSYFSGWSAPCGPAAACALDAGAALTATFTPTPVPIFDWSFDNTGVNTGSVAGSPMTGVATTYQPGKVGMALSFGSGGYATAPNVRTSLATKPKVTIALWFYETARLSSQAFLYLLQRTTAPYGGVSLNDSAAGISVCAATTTNSLLGGSCQNFAPPPLFSWHHYIIRYDGTGLGAGQGAAVDVYLDDVLMVTQPNDAANNPVFNPGIYDPMTIGGGGTLMDELKIYDQVFTVAQQCTLVIGGTWTGSSCTLP
jgi:hypothetical protein